MPKLPSKLTLTEASAALADLESALKATEPADATIDASALVDFDSSAIAVLLQCQRAARLAGRHLSLTGAPPKLIELAGLYGVDEMLGLAVTPAS